MDQKNFYLKSLNDRIEENTIILDGQGEFPKQVIILQPDGKKKEYRIIKTRKGGYILNR